VVESGGLENRYTGNCIGSSNLPLSAKFHFLDFGRNFEQGIPRPCGAPHYILRGFSTDFLNQKQAFAPEFGSSYQSFFRKSRLCS